MNEGKRITKDNRKKRRQVVYYLDFLIGQGPEKFKPFFTKDHLILASVYNSDDVLVKQ